MSLFTEPGLEVNFVNGDGTAVLLAPIFYEVGAKGSCNWLHIKVGFETDGASVPRILWAILPPWGSKITKAAIVHDYLIDLIEKGTPHEGVKTRKEADHEFANALRALGVSRARVAVIYFFVRAYARWKRITA